MRKKVFVLARTESWGLGAQLTVLDTDLEGRLFPVFATRDAAQKYVDDIWLVKPSIIELDIVE